MNIIKHFKLQFVRILTTTISARWKMQYYRTGMLLKPACFIYTPFLSHVSSPILSTPSASTNLKVEDDISHFIKLARMALERGDIDRAEGILQMSLKICDHYKSYVALPYVYDILTFISFTTGDFIKAEHLLVQVIEKLLQIGIEENSNHIIDFKLRLARIYTMYNDYGLADFGFKTCLKDQKAKILKGDSSSFTGILYVNILFWYGLHKIRKHDYYQAKKLINAAYDYSLKIRGLNSAQEMVILYTLSELNMELQDYDLALQNIQSAILLGKGTGSLDLAKCFVKLANIYMKLGAWKNAKDSASEGYRLAKLHNEADTYDAANQILQKIARKHQYANHHKDLVICLDIFI